MRVIFKLFFVLSLLSVLYALSPRPIYALACSGTGYTCRKFDCAVGEVEDTSRTCTLYDYICCKKVPTSTPAPQPSITEKPEASPTLTPAGGCWCQNGKCVGNLTKCIYIAVCPTPACSQFSQNANIKEYCTTTNTTCGIKTCAGYSASCVTTANCNKNAPGCVAITVPPDCAYNAPGCNICGYARTEAIYCNGVHCGDTCVPHALCSNSPWCSGGGGGGNTPYLSLQLLDPNLNIITPPVHLYCPPTPTPSPYRFPTPTPTIRCYGYITPAGPTRILVTTCPTYPPPTFGPQPPPGNYACFYQHTSLCKVRCDTTPCTSVACEQDVSYANFKGVPANQGASMFDLYLPSLASHLVQ
jgi:hypothetical protein